MTGCTHRCEVRAKLLAARQKGLLAPALLRWMSRAWTTTRKGRSVPWHRAQARSRSQPLWIAGRTTQPQALGAWPTPTEANPSPDPCSCPNAHTAAHVQRGAPAIARPIIASTILSTAHAVFPRRDCAGAATRRRPTRRRRRGTSSLSTRTAFPWRQVPPRLQSMNIGRG